MRSDDEQDQPPEEGVLEVPWQQLSEEALDAILSEFVSREGTDYGEQLFSFDQKKLAVLEQLKSGKATLLFDPVGNSCHIELKATLTQSGWNSQ